MLAHLATALFAIGQPPTPAPTPTAPTRGRDPWVFRCIFEDRSRMVVIAPAKDLWIAFNPNTCTIQKVWQGEMLFRGKVWDFSQDNCAAELSARVLAEAPSLVWSLPDVADDTNGATLNHVDFDPKSSWTFRTAGASITTPLLEVGGLARVFVVFDETSRRGPFHFDVSNDNGVTWDAQQFLSTTHGSSNTDWQWNFKELHSRSSQTRIRVTQSDASDQKTLRGFRIFGDSPAWGLSMADVGMGLDCTWRGYRFVEKGAAVELKYELSGREVTQVPEAHIDPTTGEVVLTSRLRIKGLEEGNMLGLALPSSSSSVVVETSGGAAPWGDAKPPKGVWFIRDGNATVTMRFAAEVKR